MQPRMIVTATWGANRLDSFGLGTDNAVYHKAWTGTGWQADWESLGGTFNSAPTAIAWGANRLDVFGLGTDNAMYHKAWTGAAWQADWENLGGTFASAPAAVAWGANRLDIFGLGTDNAMYHKAWTGAAWQVDWENLGGTFNSAPAAVAWGENRLDIFGLGTDNAMYHKAWTGAAWQVDWENLGGTFNSAPAAVAWGIDRMDVFGLGTNNAMYHKAWIGAAWQTDWENLGGVFATPFGSVPATTNLLVLAPGEFMSALQPLVQHKNQSGISAASASIARLRLYFRGVDDPETIKNAITYAHETLSTRFVALVGDVHWFPVRFYFMYNLTGNNLPSWNVKVCEPIGDWIPSDLYYANLYHHSGTYPDLAAASFDNWDANGNRLYNEAIWLDPNPWTTSNPDDVDGYPDVAVGRIPAHSALEVTAYVNKIISYETDPTRYLARGRQFAFVGDQDYGDLNWSTNMTTSSGLMGSTLVSARFLLIENDGTCQSPAAPAPAGWTNASPTDVANAANLSNWVSYVGHGGPQVWGHCGIFSDTDVALTAESTSLPVVFAAGCQTGMFISDLPWNAPYVSLSGDASAAAGNHGPFQQFPGSQPGVNGPVLIDELTGQRWGIDCAPPGCSSLPAILPTPNAYDFNRPDQGFARSWLISHAPGGAIAYFGEVGIAEDQMGVELETYLLAAYSAAINPVLGDIYLSAEQRYWGAHRNDNGSQVGDYHSVPRFYLGWMVFFGDPSLRLPQIVNLT